MNHQCHKFYYGSKEKDILASKEWLTETMIDSFHALLERNSNYAPRPVWLTMFPDQIVPLENPKKKHLQILHSDFAGGHWVTCHYNAKSVIIYDSHESSRNANTQNLNGEIRIFVERLFPFHDLRNNPIVFPKVQSQGDSFNCGPMAIAFATSILFGIDPCIVTYDQSLLRPHLSAMFAEQTIIHFPHLNTSIALLTLLPLETLKRREADALRKRLARSKETEEQRLKRLKKDAFFHKQQYVKNADSLRTQMRDKYKQNPEIKRNKMREVYKKNPNPKCQKMRDQYKKDPERQRKRKRDERKKTLKRLKEKLKSVQFWQKCFNFPKCSEFYIRRISRKIDKSLVCARLEAEQIFKWCMITKKSYVNAARRVFLNLKNTAEAALLRFNECKTLKYPKSDRIRALCGSSKHTSSSEAYFYETVYEQGKKFEQPLVTGQLSSHAVINILPLMDNNDKKSKIWHCDEKICRLSDISVEKYVKFLEQFEGATLKKIMNAKFMARLKNCSVSHTSSRLGHPPQCYANTNLCESYIATISTLSPHFPLVRNIRRNVYKLIGNYKKFHHLLSALRFVNIDQLLKITNDTKIKARFYQKNLTVSLDEEKILSQNYEAFKVMKKRLLDTPRIPCISCEKLCVSNDVSELKKLRKTIEGPFWKELMVYITEHNSDTGFICKLCLGKFRKGVLPSTCVLNNLAVKPLPDVLSNFNDYEKMLIKRMSSFQVVQTMGAVSNKHLPHRQIIRKVKGRTFHLPLPLQETLDKICPPEDPINLNHELHILVRGIPKKSKVVWENLVDINKVYKALQWLKDNNPHYSEIRLPASSDDLLNDKLQETEYQIVDNEGDESNEETDEVQQNKDNNNQTVLKRKAFLTQITQDSGINDQYTVYPMRVKRIDNESSLKLYQMLKIEDVPMNNRYKYLDVMCFPDLYPEGINGQREDRNFALPEYLFIRTRLMSKHSRFRLNLQYLFFLLNDANNRQLKSGIYYTMMVANARERYTAGKYLNELKDEQLESNLISIFAKLRNTDQFWRLPSNNVKCMTLHYGPATWFLTLSPSEWKWSDLGQYLRDMNPDKEKLGISELIAYDPVSTSRFMCIKFKAMIDFICSADHPIGEVIHYFWRLEYQTRGIQHMHCMIWIKDAPVLGKSPDEEVVTFIQKYVTCAIPDENVSPTLYETVTSDQNHKHNSYCMRTKKTETNIYRKCRFDFPRTVTKNFVLRDVVTSIVGRRNLRSKSRLYDLPRKKSERFINDYNPAIKLAWEGNMDIQFVGEKSEFLNSYLTKYTTKSEKCNIDFGMIDSNKPLASKLWNFAMFCLNNRECGALEAADTLLGNPLYGTDSDTIVKWIDVNEVRNRKVKTFKEIKALDEDSTNIYCPSLIDDHYPNRPEELESLNLYDFARFWEIAKQMPKSDEIECYKLASGLFLKKRKKCYLINHYRFNVKTEPEKYFYSLLLLFKPWRDLSELKGTYETCTDAFKNSESALTKAMKYHERLEEIQKAFEDVAELIEKRENNLKRAVDGDKSDDDELDCNLIEADGVMKDLEDFGKIDVPINLSQMMSQLNEDQKRVFDSVCQVLQNKNQILRLFVSGEGGTGKSFLIETIKHWIRINLKKTTAISAPTGIAAFNIDGLTIHRMFQLPITHESTPKYMQLSDMVLKTLRDKLKNVELFIIDEVSMISNVTLMFINLRLCEIFDTTDTNDGFFGRKHILLFGDLLQLPPVKGHPPFVKMFRSDVQKYLGTIGGFDLWRLFDYDELLINMRQRCDNRYRDILSRIRIGLITDSDINVLESRKIVFKESSCNERLNELCTYMNQLPIDTICLLPTCYLCKVLNTAMLSKIDGDEILLIAEDDVDCAPAMKKKVQKILEDKDDKVSETAGIERVITIKIGVKVMIRRNIDVTLGLVNGTVGNVVAVNRAADGNRIDSIKLVTSDNKEFTITRVDIKFEVFHKIVVHRRQFPLSLSYGITIHKSQGVTCKTAMMDLGTTIFSDGQAYVGLSRVSTLEGLHLINFNPASVKAHSGAISEYNRLRSLFKSQLPQIDSSKKEAVKVYDRRWTIPSIIDNVQNHGSEEPESIVTWKIYGLRNDDNVSCYANVILQCAFHCVRIRQQILKYKASNALTDATCTYIERKLCNVQAIRRSVGERFEERTQQDASEFFIALTSTYSKINDVLEHELKHVTCCSNAKCNYTVTTLEKSCLLILPIQSTLKRKKSVTLQNLIDLEFSKWETINGNCNECKGTILKKKTVIESTSSILVIQLNLYTYVNGVSKKIINNRINAIPKSNITIDKKKYKVISAIFHEGEQMNRGHYTCMLRTGKKSEWYCCNDVKVIRKKWPKGAQGVYILFLEQIK